MARRSVAGDRLHPEDFDPEAEAIEDGDDADDDDEPWASDPFDDDEDREDREDRRDRAAVPVYGVAVDLGKRVMTVVDEYRGDQEDRPGDATTDGESDGELFARAFIGVQIAAAKVIGGHAMGYDDEVLCGNIVNCRRALAAAVDGRQAWQGVRDRRLVPVDVVDDLLAGHDHVITLINERIADLRSRVHW